ncbi:MAG: urease accessory protein UreE [Roseimicrobium sp.]
MAAPSSARPEDSQIILNAERSMFLKRRWRAAAQDGVEFGFDLEDRLKDGCVIFQTDVADYVLRQIPELVYQIQIASPDFAALVGWKVGNLHFPVQITGEWVRITHDPAIRQLLEREGWPFEEATVVFNPLRVVPHAS